MPLSRPCKGRANHTFQKQDGRRLGIVLVSWSNVKRSTARPLIRLTAKQTSENDFRREESIPDLKAFRSIVGTQLVIKFKYSGRSNVDQAER